MHTLFNLLAAILPLRHKIKARIAQMRYMKAKRLLIAAIRKALLPPALHQASMIDNGIIIGNRKVSFAEILDRKYIVRNAVKGEQ